MTVSIVIPVYNQLHFTKQCVKSLLRDRDRCAYELIIVDNASSDGTREYLEELKNDLKFGQDRLIAISNNENKGVAPAWNQGLREATGDYIAILNNDIVVSQGWLRSLLWALDFHKLSLVSPFAATGELNYDFEERAAKFAKKNTAALWQDYDFCAVVLPRSTFDKIGFFDEKFLVGGYEDTDYAYRLKAEGMKYGVSGAAFIHHFGSQTLGEFKKRGDKHAGHNKAYFVSKWKVDPSANVGAASMKLKRFWRRLKLRFDWM